MRLAGKTVLVTGAARGIGAASARRLVDEGARVALADRREDELLSLRDELNALLPGACIACALDVSDEQSWQHCVADVVNTLGDIDVLVNCAGILRVAPLLETDLATLRKVLDTNLVGTFLAIQAIVPSMRCNGGGSIITFSSVQGVEGREGLAAYSASKFAVRGLVKTAALELGPEGIRVNAIVPGPVKTKMTERPGWSDEDYDRRYRDYPLARMADAREIADMVVFLASNESAYCTGADFVVDGGMLAGKPVMPAVDS